MKIKIILLVLLSLVLTGCLTNSIKRSNSASVLNPKKSVIIGVVTEGYLTRPHRLIVDISSTSKILKGEKAKIRLQTKSSDDDIYETAKLGSRFMYEVPAGEYEITQWRYFHYLGNSLPRETPIKFKLKAGEIAYIGNLHGVALTFCLSNYDHYDKEIKKIVAKYPVLKGKSIVNKSKKIDFKGWGHQKSTDVFGKGICKYK